MKNPLESLPATIVLGVIITVIVILLVNVSGPDAASVPTNMPSLPG